MSALTPLESRAGAERPGEQAFLSSLQARFGTRPDGGRGSGRKAGATGAALIVLALLVPASAWVHAVRIPPPELESDLLLGARLFRAGLAVLGVFVWAGGWWGWWSRDGSPQQEHPVPGARWWMDGGLVGILAAAIVLRGLRLDAGLWLDEILTAVLYARAPFGEILTTYDSQNQHFLFSLLVRGSFLLFGESPWALRLPAVLFGIGSIWAVYRLGREVSDVHEARLAAALLTFSYHHVWFSQNGRGYTGALLWTLVSSWLFLRGLSERRRRFWLYYAVVVSLGVYTHMTILFVVVGHFAIYLGTLWVRRGRPWPDKWVPLLGGFGLAALLTFQLYALTIPQIVGPALADLSPVPTWRSPLWTVAELARGLHVGFAGGLAVLLAMLVIGVGTVSYLRSRPVVPLLLAIPVVVGSGVTVAIGHPLWPRFFFFGLGFGALIVVRGIRVLGEAAGRLLHWSPRLSRNFALALTMSAIALSAVSLPGAYRPKQDFVGARDFINQARGPGDAVAVVGLAAFPYRSYFAPEWETVESLAQLNAVRVRSKRTWLVYMFPLHMEAVHSDILAVARREFALVRSFEGSLNGGTIFVYRSDRPGPVAVSWLERGSP